MSKNNSKLKKASKKRILMILINTYFLFFNSKVFIKIDKQNYKKPKFSNLLRLN